MVINRESLGELTRINEHKRANATPGSAFRTLAQLRKYDEEIMKSRAINNASATAGGI